MRKSRLLPLFAFVLIPALQPLVGQSGRSAGNMPANTPTISPSGSDSDRLRNILVTGNVVTGEGSLPPERVAIQRVCGTEVIRLGYTDPKGFFSLQLRETVSALQDAGDSSRDPYIAGSMTAQMIDSPVLQPAGSSQSTGSGIGMASGCELRGQLAGYQSTSVMVIATPSPQGVNVGTIVLLPAQEQGSTISRTSSKAPRKARKAFENAEALLRKQNLKEAQADLEQAVLLYPRFAAAWVKLGSVYEQQDRLEQAQTAFSQAQAADSKFVPAYMGLASVAVRQAKWEEAKKFSTRATELDGVDFPAGFYYAALANLELGELDQAEKAARMAERLDVRHSLPQVKLLLGTILARKRDYSGAIEELTLYSKSAPGAANLDRVRQQIARLETLSKQPDQSPQPASLVSPLMTAPSQKVEFASNREELAKAVAEPPAKILDNWAPSDIDEAVPPVRPSVPCPVGQVVSAAGIRAKELMANLQQFTATERIEHVAVNKKGQPSPPETATFKYVAQIREAKPGQLEAEEYRNGHASSQAFPAKMLTTGMVAHALLLHPDIVDDLALSCEGLGSVEGKPAWQLHFVQHPTRSRQFRSIHTRKGWFNEEMKGRVWVAADSYQVIRMETDLAKPIEEIALRKDHVIIDYRPVPFPKRNVELWLPESVDLYVDISGQRSHRRHSFSNFELFWIDLNEKVKDPPGSGG